MDRGQNSRAKLKRGDFLARSCAEGISPRAKGRWQEAKMSGRWHCKPQGSDDAIDLRGGEEVLRRNICEMFTTYLDLV